MDNKHAPYDLKQMQSLPLEAKIVVAQQRIREWYEYWDGQVCISFSGGKDSTVLLHLVRQLYPDVPAVFVDTGLEFPEIRKFATSIPNVIVVRPSMRFDNVIKTYGYPVIGKKQSRYINDLQTAGTHNEATVNLRLTGYNRAGNYCPSMKLAQKWVYLKDAPFKISDKCCEVMKKSPLKEYQKKTGRKPYVGVMACESSMRERHYLREGCNAFDAASPVSRPLSVWLETDILEYLERNKLPYASVYGDIVRDENGKPFTTGESRTGCIYCMYGCHLEKKPNRFQRLKETHPRQYEYCIGGGETIDGKWHPNKDGLGLGKVLDAIGVKYD